MFLFATSATGPRRKRKRKRRGKRKITVRVPIPATARAVARRSTGISQRRSLKTIVNFIFALAVKQKRPLRIRWRVLAV